MKHGVQQANPHTAVLINGRYVWLKPNTTTRECQHVDIGVCRNCAYPMAPRQSAA